MSRADAPTTPARNPPLSNERTAPTSRAADSERHLAVRLWSGGIARMVPGAWTQPGRRKADMVHVGLCEDDPAIRRVVSEALKLTGHTVSAAHDGGEALRRFGDDDSLDVIVLDIGLPDSDGRDVCQALRSA